ncbi:putative RNA methyltransferase [Eionea flava]
MTPTPTLYRCPVCEHTLHDDGKRLACENNHSFDKHKKGYINLLLAHHKNSLSPGDNIEMVNGRREFLRAGYYQPFANAITQLLADHLLNQPLTIVDAGCGEGYYTEQLQAEFSNAQVYGFDISKPAIHSASTNKTVHWSVASSHRPPMLNSSADVITSIFSPIECDAFHTLLKPGGYILYAAPNHNHLKNLRKIIYDEVRDYSTEKHQHYFDHRFKKIEQRSLQIPIELPNHETIIQLLNMTPHAHRISAAGHQRLSNTKTLHDIGDFVLYFYQKITD